MKGVMDRLSASARSLISWQRMLICIVGIFLLALLGLPVKSWAVSAGLPASVSQSVASIPCFVGGFFLGKLFRSRHQQASKE